MPSENFAEDFAEFTAQLTDAMARAVEERTRGGRALGGKLGGIVTAGVVMVPHRDDDFLTIQDGRETRGSRGRRLSGRSLERLATGAELGRDSIAQLNEDLGDDPADALALLRSVADDPTVWGTLFELSPREIRQLKDPDPNDLDELQRLIDALSVYEDDLMSINFSTQRAKPADSARGASRARAAGRSPFLPDGLEIKGEADTDGKAKVTATLTWKF
jgi:hypothetical protein